MCDSDSALVREFKDYAFKLQEEARYLDKDTLVSMREAINNEEKARLLRETAKDILSILQSKQ